MKPLIMATTATPSIYLATTRPCIVCSRSMLKPNGSVLSMGIKDAYGNYLSGSRPRKLVTRATLPEENEKTKPVSGLPIDLKGKRAFVAGVADDNGYGWAIAKSLAAAGAEIIIGTWVPAKNIFEHNLRHGKLDNSRVLPDGSLMDIAKIYPLDASYDTPDDVPENIKTNKRYAGHSNWTIQLGMENSQQYLSFLLEKPSIEYVTTDLSWQEVAESVKQDFGSIDILVHSLANGPEVTKPLLKTSRSGYLAAISASTYSYLSLLQHFIPIMNPGGSSLSLTYIASTRLINNYGGGMSSAKAALECDTRMLAFEAGRKHKIRINAISPGPLASRAAKAIGEIEEMVDYSFANAPLQKELNAGEVGNVAAFLASPLASAVTGAVVYVDNGLNIMGVAVDSPSIKSVWLDYTKC